MGDIFCFNLEHFSSLLPRVKKQILLATILFSFQAKAQLMPSSIVDGVDFIRVEEDLSNIPQKFHNAAESIGRLSMGCTGTHIGDGLVLTAGHCFDASSRIEKNQPCPNVKIAWGYRGSRPSSLISSCQNVVIKQNRPGADYALFEVRPIPPNKVEVDLRNLDFDNERATLFSHPRKQALLWSRYCKLKILDPAPRDPTFLYHKCDTEPGSSGAALIMERNLKIASLHKGGLDFGIIGVWNYSTALRETPILEIIKRRRP